jgi:hypothetical protein
MKEKSAIFKGWLKFWSFFASLFCDQAGSMSQKRVIPLGAFIMFCRLIEKNIDNPLMKIDENLLVALIIIILGGIGLTIPEWFSKKVNKPPEPAG